MTLIARGHFKLCNGMGNVFKRHGSNLQSENSCRIKMKIWLPSMAKYDSFGRQISTKLITIQLSEFQNETDMIKSAVIGKGSAAAEEKIETVKGNIAAANEKIAAVKGKS